MPRESYRIADLIVDVGAATVERDDESLPVRGLSFDLLVALARHAPDVVDHDTLAREVWELASVTDETIMQRVTLLRRALGDEASRPTYVRSVRGRGYALVPQVEPIAPAPEPDNGASRRSSVIWAVAAALVVVAGVAGLGYRRGDGAGQQSSSTVKTAPLTANEMVRQADEFLARHRQTDNELAIDLYERSLELEPDHPRALVGLSLGLSQRVSKFNHPPAEARRALDLAERRLAAAPEDARAHYARAFALDCRGRIGPALESYQRAAALDPDNRVPKADAAYLQMVRGDFVDALAVNLEVLAAGERLHYVEVEIGWSLALLGFEDAAAIWLQRALDLWPDSPFAGSTFARFRLHQGRLGEAERLAVEAIGRGVERAELPTTLGNIALLRGDRQQAAQRYVDAEKLSSRINPAALRLLVLEKGKPTAEARYRELAEAVRDGLAEGDEWPGTAVNEMLLHAGFGEFEAALTALDTAIDLGYRESAWLMLDPVLGALREHPGFVDRIERIALELERERQALLAAPELTDAFLNVTPRAPSD